MKRRILFQVILFGVLLAAIPACGRSQSLVDDIQQLLMDYQKLAQEKKILTDMYTGYKIVSQGYGQIKSIARGNFTLHQTFLNSLLAVSPAVRNYYKVISIINNEAELVREYQSAQHYFQSGGHFTAAELDYFSTLYGNLLTGSLQNLDELEAVMSPGTLRMSDAERLGAIDRIDGDMTTRLNFLRAFNDDAAIQAGRRGIEQNDAAAMLSLYGINQ
jgi:hypothetical protein